MFSKQKLKNIKWFTIAGAIINLVAIVILFVGMAIAISNIESAVEINNIATNNQLYLYNRYIILINILAVDIVFSLLLISMSFRIDQIYYRLKWVNITTDIISVSVTIFVALLAKKYASDGALLIQSPILYVLIGVGALLILVDHIILIIKYKDNPFYHNGKFKNTSNTRVYQANTKEYITPEKREQDKVVDEKDVFDSNMSYFEMYEKRSQELKKVEEDFDNGLIDEQEYNKRRKDIYAKYDRYN